MLYSACLVYRDDVIKLGLNMIRSILSAAAILLLSVSFGIPVVAEEAAKPAKTGVLPFANGSSRPVPMSIVLKYAAPHFKNPAYTADTLITDSGLELTDSAQPNAAFNIVCPALSESVSNKGLEFCNWEAKNVTTYHDVCVSVTDTKVTTWPNVAQMGATMSSATAEELTAASGVDPNGKVHTYGVMYGLYAKPHEMSDNKGAD